MNKLIKTMLRNRGYSDTFLQDINTCGHDLPANLDAICRRLDHYRKTGERVVLLTDFDMDGLMSGVIGFAGLAEMGFNAALALPDTRSYGFGAADVDEVYKEYPDVRAIVTADVGVTAFDGVDRAVELGIEVLVTDHHKPAGIGLPNAAAVVDPMCDTGDNVFGGICGAHVLYLVLKWYAQHYHPDPVWMVPQIERLRVFAGFGTVSDSMPVYHENRPLIRDAISICRLVYADGDPSVVNQIPGCDIYRRAFVGLYEALDLFHEAGKFRDTTGIDEEFFGFYLAPAFNSIKRMQGDTGDAYTVFFGGADAARESMQHILDMTEERKRLVEEALSKILDSATPQPWAPYIWMTDSPGGIRGLLAQKIRSMTGEPALVVGYGSDGISLVGSGRCPSWFPFLKLCGSLDYVHAAGHDAAFGVSIEGPEGCSDLVAFLKQAIHDTKPADALLAWKPDYRISTVSESADTDIDPELFEEFLDEIELYRPFGTGFPSPVGELEFRPSEGEWSYLGKEHTHIKVILPHGLVLLCFNQAHMFPGDIREDLFPKTVRVRGHLNLNVFNGVSTVQFLGDLPSEMDQSDSKGVLPDMTDSVDTEIVMDAEKDGDDA